MSIQLQEIQSIFISQNRLVEGKDYKRAEWLKGDGTAIIAGVKYNLWTNQVEMEIGSTNVTRKFEIYYYVSPSLNWTIHRNPSSNTQLLVIFREKQDGSHIFETTSMPSQLELSFYQKGGYAYCLHGGTETKGYRLNQSSWDIDITPTIYSYNMSYIREILPNGSYRSNLTPCQLLRSIPATLDANNIARTAGECGMVDSISGKFYGNVASSGSFSVEGLDESGTVEDTRLHQIYRNKLVEGKDYTLGEMLKGDDNYPYISIPNLQNFNLEAHRTTSNNHTLIEGTYTQYQGTTSTASINYISQINRSSSNVISGIFKSPVRIDNDVTIEKRYKAGYDALKFNGANCVRNANEPIYKGTDLRTVTKLIANNNSYIVSLKGNKTYANSDEWKYTFVPCQLLRSIPRNLDAQCKSRQAGECGMIDLINGRFYGNVSSSGTFSLAWDEWLKDCTIQFDAMKYYQGMPMEYPPTINYYARVEVAKLPDELTDFGFVKLSKTQIVLGENTWANSPTLLGNDKWATVRVNMGGGSGGNVVINGTSLEQQAYVSTITACTINLRGIMQINKIDFTNYADADHTYSWTFTRGVDEETNKQYLVDDFEGNKIYQD